MPRVCPRPCSRLASAAVFISVGVVQLIVGTILLRSKYVYLIAGPDFWTSCCNIVVGCLVGLSAVTWKRSRKQLSKKHLVRRNVLVALLCSSLTLNGTTLGILLLGQGNTHTSIQIETLGNSDSTFESEILAYAFVTSLCCPIVVIVISIVSISGTFFKYATIRKSMDAKTPLNSIGKVQPRNLRWVYSPELLELSKRKIREYMSSSAESSEDDLDTPTHQKRTDSAEDIQNVFKRMALGKRDSLCSDGAIMLRQLEERRKKRSKTINADGSYIVEISRSKESTPNEMDYVGDELARYESSHKKAGKSRRDFTDVNGNTRLGSDADMRRAIFAKRKQLAMLYGDAYASEKLLNEYQKASSQLTKHYPSQYRKMRKSLQSTSGVDNPVQGFISDVTDYEAKNAAKVHKLVKMSESEPMKYMSRSGECIHQNEIQEIQESSANRRAETDYQRYETGNCLALDGSVFDEDSNYDGSRTSSFAGEVVSVNLKPLTVAKLSSKLIPVSSPVVPDLPSKQEIPKVSDDSGISTLESNSFSEVTKQDDLTDMKSNLSTFKDISPRNKENQPASQSIRIYDRMSTMESISEESNFEMNPAEEETRSHSLDEEVLIASKSHSRKKSVPPEQPAVATNQDENTLESDLTSKKKSISSRSLKKIWSMASLSENQNDFMSQVVDQDSLIGLSEKELIERQLRTRSIRRSVQQRLKEEISV